MALQCCLRAALRMEMVRTSTYQRKTMCYVPYLYLLPRQLCVILHKFRWLIPSSLFGPQVMIIMIASSHPVFHPIAAIAS